MDGCGCLYPLIRDLPSQSKTSVPQIGAADVRWQANLDLSFIRREDRTLLAARSIADLCKFKKRFIRMGPAFAM